MRIVILLHLFCFVCGLSAQTIEWEKIGQLEWKNYKGKPNKMSSFQALTATGISFSINYEGEQVRISILNTFDPNNSWSKDKKSDYLLAHEQLHFDISELFARKLRKELLETDFDARGKKLMNEIAELYQQKMKELDRFQKNYDKETDHSLIETAQKEWELKVKQEIKQLEQFASSEVQILLPD